MSFIRINRYEVTTHYIQYVHEEDDGNFTPYIGLGDYATKVPIPKGGPEAKLISDRLRHSGGR